MKTAKKILAFLLAAALMLAVLPAAFADDGGEDTTTYTLTIKGNTGTKISASRTFEVYQVYTGTAVLKNTKWYLSDVKYGTGWDDRTVGNDVPEAELKEWETDTADTLSSFFMYKGDPYATISSGLTYNDEQGTYTVECHAGYYAVFETTTNTNMPESQGKSGYMVQVVGDNTATVTLKDGTVSFTKQVMDINDSTGVKSEWQDSADYDIYDYIPFKLTITLPMDYESYTNYKLNIVDTPSAGISNPVTYIDAYYTNPGVTERVKFADGEFASGTMDGYPEGTFCIWSQNLRDIEEIKNGATIELEYSCQLQSGAALGAAGNPNTAYLEFSNDYYAWESKGKTPEDQVIIFTYQLDVNKVVKNAQYNKEDPNSKEFVPLEGAQFKLEKKMADNIWKAITLDKNGATFTAKGIDDGQYRITETEAPDGYNKIDPIYFTVSATHTNDTDSTPLKLISLSGTETDKDGGNLSNGLTFRGNVTNGTLSFDVENQAGSILPSTGGTGTTVFYVVGTVLALGAAILLIAKKRVKR